MIPPPVFVALEMRSMQTLTRNVPFGHQTTYRRGVQSSNCQGSSFSYTGSQKCATLVRLSFTSQMPSAVAQGVYKVARVSEEPHPTNTSCQSYTAKLLCTMQFSTIFVALAAYASLASAARVQFYTELGCGSASEDYQNVQCNSCIDPPGDWASVQVSEIGNQRWTVHNQNSCTPSSQVFQGYGGGCTNMGHTAIRSVWVNC